MFNDGVFDYAVSKDVDKTKINQLMSLRKLQAHIIFSNKKYSLLPRVTNFFSH